MRWDGSIRTYYYLSTVSYVHTYLDLLTASYAPIITTTIHASTCRYQKFGCFLHADLFDTLSMIYYLQLSIYVG